MPKPRYKVSYQSGIPHVTEAWVHEIQKPEEEECKKQEQIDQYVRQLQENQIREHALILRRQAEERAREQARAAQAAAEIEQKFCALAEQWYVDTMPLSSYYEKILHPAYQKILTLGKAAVPFILRELADEPNDWFWALRIITDADPVTAEQAGDMEAMAEAWLRWGRGNGYI